MKPFINDAKVYRSLHVPKKGLTVKTLIILLIECLSLGLASRAYSFMPENDLHLTPTLQGGVEEQQFHEILDQVEHEYEDVFAQHGAKLEINRKWDDETVNAQAMQWGNTWRITMFGGLARRTTVDAFTLVACHEIGHHLGGSVLSAQSYWASNEGQSDYFASLSCVRRLWRYQSERYELNKLELSNLEGGETLKNRCDEVWPELDDRQICYRSIVAAKNLSDLLANGKSSPKVNTPAQNKVTKTDHQHPEAQCRLDTYIAASLCPISWDEGVIPGKFSTDPQGLAGIIAAKSHACHSFQHHVGARPSCWFKEPDAPKVRINQNIEGIELANDEQTYLTSLEVKNFDHLNVRAKGTQFELYLDFNKLPSEHDSVCSSSLRFIPRFCHLNIPRGMDKAHIMIKGKKNPSPVSLFVTMVGTGRFCRNYDGGYAEAFNCYDGLRCRIIDENADKSMQDTWCIDY
jgi:predicted Zn-dependent protease with MMP-like domain